MSATNCQGPIDPNTATRLLQDWWTDMGVAPDRPIAAAPPKAPAVTPAAPSPTIAARPSSPSSPSSPPPPKPNAQTLDELKAAMEEAKGQILPDGGRKTVFARGCATSGLMLIGEAPGADEDAQGYPFVGRAGQLLDKMFAAIDRPSDTGVYITNLVPWRPPANRDPTPEEVAFCRPFLLRHIELIAPKLLISAGRFATHTLLQTKAAMSGLRGREHSYQHDGFGPIPCIPIMHPAYLLRRPPDKARAWRDMLVIAQRLKQLDGDVSD